ncbi:hypothetical protein FACS1894159_04690 [Bacteroidia bacterium]|nr:hypothetical protein FACS1894159_04690 [Bacteroidia bacterium]
MTTIAQTLSYRALELRTWLYAALLIAANVALPQLFHLAGLGGAVFVPILFFTLLAAVRYGAACAATVAVLSPLVSFALVGMPAAATLWTLMIKGVAMAAVAGLLIRPGYAVRLWQVAVVAAAAQVVGMAFQIAILGTFAPAWAAVTTALPGIALQIAAVWAICRLSR